MAWKERSRVDERVLLLSEYVKGERSMTDLCSEFGVSRKTAYKWLARYHAEGPGGLEDRSRAPHTHPNRVEPIVAEALLMGRKAHPHWGARKVLAWLAKTQPKLELPAASTVSALYAKYGLSRPHKTRRRTPPYTDPFADATEPNRLWCADFKGDFQTGDRHRCYPLTLTDACSRMLLCCGLLRSTKTPRVRSLFEAALRENGLPERIRTDNGTPFASRGAGGLSRLSVWWLKLGIRHERIRPGHPEQNGRHERMHRTLKHETLKPPAANVRVQQARFDEFRKMFNEERPHEALEYRTPSSCFAPSPRAYPNRLSSIEYASEFKTRVVAASGRVRWQGALVMIGHALEGEVIGLQPDDGMHQVYFADLRLGFIDDRRPEIGLIRPPVTCWARAR
jgi:putative transposase